MNQPERAVSHLEVLRRLGRADAPSLLLLGDIYTNQNLNHLAVAAYQEALGLERPATAAQAIRIAGTLTARGQFDDAVDFIGRIRTSFPDLEDRQELELLNLEAEIALAEGNEEEAAEILERIVDRDPMNGRALLTLGNYYAGQEEFEEAAFFFQRAEALPNFAAEAFVDHARMRVAQQEFGDAVRLLRRAQEIRPRDNVARYLEAVERIYQMRRL
ncbi:MAG: hypothetical protein EA425_00860 [Puniceicoccaceae bacterium]|nr:MAG: hypothetical protein EA425_00860 [Puniceicoccaceae bacterium]